VAYLTVETDKSGVLGYRVPLSKLAPVQFNYLREITRMQHVVGLHILSLSAVIRGRIADRTYSK
jgi:hypothetical protein